MSEDLGIREYLNIPRRAGMWYVSNQNPTLRGIGSHHRDKRKCIIGGPFTSEDAAYQWNVQNGSHPESQIWKEIEDSP